MTKFAYWCSFVGAWLLVAGPIYQAALELSDQDLERDRIAAVGKTVQHPDPVSPWWWLIPPVKYILERRRSRAYHTAVLSKLDSTDVDALLSYLNKALGWLLVAVGGLLIAVGSTWQLCEQYGWDQVVCWPVVLVMSAGAVTFTAVRMSRTRTAGQQ